MELELRRDEPVRGVGDDDPSSQVDRDAIDDSDLADDEKRSIVTSAKARPTAGGDQPSALQVAAARLVVVADRKLGDTTPEWIERVAHGLPPRRQP